MAEALDDLERRTLAAFDELDNADKQRMLIVVAATPILGSAMRPPLADGRTLNDLLRNWTEGMPQVQGQGL